VNRGRRHEKRGRYGLGVAVPAAKLVPKRIRTRDRLLEARRPVTEPLAGIQDGRPAGIVLLLEEHADFVPLADSRTKAGRCTRFTE
jgi:hypothetical protein